MAKPKRNARRDGKAARAKPTPRVPLEASPARNVVLRKVKDLREHPRNVRTHPVAQLAVLDESFSDHGQVKPLVINPDGMLLAGHGSREALMHIYGPDAEVACVIVDQDDTLQRKFMLRDNAGAAMSGWNKDGLGIELADLKGLGVADLSTLGFRPAELKRLMPEGEREGAHDPDADAPPAQAEAVSRPGDIWLLGEHRLMCGSSITASDVCRLMDGHRAVLCNTDPPYGIDYSKLKDGIPRFGFANHQAKWGDIENDTLTDGAALQAFLEEMICLAAAHAVRPDAAWYFWHPMLTQGTFFAAAAAAAAADILIHRQIVWCKPRFVLTRSGMYHWQHELCFYGWVRGNVPPWLGDKSQTTVWEVGRDQDAGQHPTQKPVELFTRPIRNHAKEGEIVFEPFSGSGSQIIAAEMTGRRCYGLEIAPAYVDVAVLRWEGFAKKTAILAATGETWAAVRARRATEATETKAAA